ncbi:hypothetical protein ABZ630_21015, partial [Streptomyces albidoflavus]
MRDGAPAPPRTPRRTAPRRPPIRRPVPAQTPPRNAPWTRTGHPKNGGHELDLTIARPTVR